MKYSKLLLASFAISLLGYGCESDTISNPSDKSCEEDETCTKDCSEYCNIHDKECNDGDVMECQFNEETQCPEWTVAETCTENMHCDATELKCVENTGDPSENCSESCSADDKKCSNGDVMKCVINEETQCPEWTVAEICTENMHCDKTELKCVENTGDPSENCSESCTADDKKCSNGDVMKCVINEETQCPEWTVAETCTENMHCDKTQLKCVKSCEDKCDINSPSKCEKGNAVSCKLDNSGCTVYQTETCETGTYCDDEKGICVQCKETCKTSKRCTSKGVETCKADAHGCAEWTLTATCKSNQTCDETKLSCVDSCTPECTSDKICNKGKCECDATLPKGWPLELKPLNYPIMVPTKASSMNGADNIYAPEIHVVSGKHIMWYGAQGGDGHDRIFMAWSNDGAEWHKYPSDNNPQPVLQNGSSNHVNDPSVVHVGNTWKMYYTDAANGIDDRIWLAESKDLVTFKKVQMVIDKGPSDSWEAEKVGRPAVLYEDGIYKMWYDGQVNSKRHVGYATSTDGIHFTKHPNNPVLKGAGAIDVKKIDDVYVLVHEGGDGTHWATSVNGVCWIDRGILFNKSGADYDKYGQVTPFLEVLNGKLQAVWYGGASARTWNVNRIGAAYESGKVPSGGGCTACTTAGWSCAQACMSAKAGNTGHCANPGSTSPGACCACTNDGCEKCSTMDCNTACTSNGHSGGFCANPGSTDSSKCCACFN